MDYHKAAEELLEIRAELIQTPVHRMMDEFVRGECFVLNYLLQNNGRAYPKDLSKGMSVSTARIAALLNQMEKKGWVTRATDAVDNRQTVISLTEKGCAEIQGRRTAIIDAVADMLAEAGAEDTGTLLRIQRKMCKGKKAPEAPLRMARLDG